MGVGLFIVGCGDLVKGVGQVAHQDQGSPQFVGRHGVNEPVHRNRMSWPDLGDRCAPRLGVGSAEMSVG
jgi:hypothetical protein